MKKIALITFAILAVSAILTGCSKSEEAAPAEGTTNTAPTGSETPAAPQ